MWRIWNKLLGWQYAVVNIAYNDHIDHIARVHADGDGHPYVRIFGMHVDLKTTDRQWRGLTFPRAAVEEAAPSADVIVIPRAKAR